MKKFLKLTKEFFTDPLNITAIVGAILQIIGLIIVVKILGWWVALGLFLWTWGSSIQQDVNKERRENREFLIRNIFK